MLKRFLFALAPAFLLIGTASADNDLLSRIASLESDSIVAADSADVALEDEDDFGQADVDALLGDDDKDDDAVAACFRRIGYGYGYSSYGRSYRSVGYSYSYRCYRPTYTYHYYRPVTYHYPVTYHVPVYSHYWACY